MCKYVLIAQKHNLMEFDKDELISRIDNFDEFDREGRTLTRFCESEIAKSIGVPEENVFVTKLEYNYDDNSKYLAKYYIRYYYDEDELREVIDEYASRFDSEVVSCEITNKNEIIKIKVTFTETSQIGSERMRSLMEPNLKKMLCERFPNFNFDVRVTFRVLYWSICFLSMRGA